MSDCDCDCGYDVNEEVDYWKSRCTTAEAQRDLAQSKLAMVAMRSGESDPLLDLMHKLFGRYPSVEWLTAIERQSHGFLWQGGEIIERADLHHAEESAHEQLAAVMPDEWQTPEWPVVYGVMLPLGGCMMVEWVCTAGGDPDDRVRYGMVEYSNYRAPKLKHCPRCAGQGNGPCRPRKDSDL